MSSFEELRDQWIHDHVPSATLSLHYVFEAAENRIAALEAEALQQTECAHKALKQCDRAEKKLDSMKIMERHADWKLRAEAAEARVAELEKVIDCHLNTDERRLEWELAEAKHRIEDLTLSSQQRGADADGFYKRAKQAEALVAELKRQMDQCVWMLHKAAQEYMTGSRAVISWTDYIRDLESRWAAREAVCKVQHLAASDVTHTQDAERGEDGDERVVLSPADAPKVKDREEGL